jgi:uridine kinase
MYIIGIAGGSGSGKTTFAKKIIKKVSDPNVILLSQDSYYLPVLPDHLKINDELNFDHPEAFDWKLLKEHLLKLKKGESISVPIYEYKLNQRTDRVITLDSSKVVILEGIYTLWANELRSLLELKVYINVEADIRFIRRLHRDVKDRGRTHDEIIKRYYDMVRPMHQLYLEPTKKYADLIVGEENDIAVDILSARIKELLNQ